MTNLKLPKFHWAKLLSIFFFILLLGAYANIFAIGIYNPGETLDPTCTPGSLDCTVNLNTIETDPITGAINGLVKADGAGNISAVTSGTDIKTINGSSILGSGDILVSSSPITVVNGSNLFSTGLTGTGSGVTSTSRSIFLGPWAGDHATNASRSIFLGPWAGDYATNAYNSIFLGQYTGHYAANASSSIFLGTETGYLAVNAVNSIFIGQKSGYFDGVDNTTNGLSSIIIGSFASTGGYSNSIILGSGVNGGYISNTKANQFMLAPSLTEMRLRGVDYTLPASQGGANTVLTNDGSGVLTWGTVAGGLLSDADFNTKGGTNAGLNIVSGAQNNTFIGYEAGKSASIGSSALADNNIAIGYRSLYFNTMGYNNHAIGSSALYSNTTGTNNSANGSNSLYSNTTGGNNIAIGNYSLYANSTGSNNNAMGVMSLQNNTGDGNSAFGSMSLSSNTTGIYNSAIGFNSLSSNTSGNFNISIGYQSGRYITNGSTANQTSSRSIYLGVNTRAQSDGDINEIVIGDETIGNGSDTTTIGNTSTLRTYLTGLNLKAGTATAGTAPLKLTSGTNLGTTEAGAIEYDGSHLYFTATNGGARYQLDQQSGGGLLSDADYNTKGGTSAGLNLVAGAQHNTFLGYEAGKSAAAGGTNAAGYNTAIGSQSLYSNTTGSSNTANGYYSLLSNTTGFSNTAIGANSLSSNTTGRNNTASGDMSLSANTIGRDNTAIGVMSLPANTTGNGNTAIGKFSFFSNKTGSVGVAIGVESQYYTNDTLIPWTNDNTSVGYQSLRGSTTAANNTGIRNTVIGYQALYSNTTGSSNTANGYLSLISNTTGSDNTASGFQSLRFNTLGTQNTATGYYSLGSNTIGNYNTTNGGWSMNNNIDGSYNTAAGYSTLLYNTTGSQNIAYGAYSLYSNTTGSNNIGLGYQAGRYAGAGVTANQTSTNSFYLGYNTRASADGNTNEIVIGYGTLGRGSNTAQWGNTSMTGHYFSGNIQLSTYGAGSLNTDASGNVTASSDERLKDIQGDFNNNNDALSIISSINPILYKWNDESGFDQTTMYAGFSAQNIKDFIPEAVGLDKNGYLTLSDRPILATAINAIQELDLKVKNLDEKINGVTLSDMMGEFFGGVIVSVSDGIAYMKGIVVDTLKVGSPEKRTGITLYDEITGYPYCLSISGGVTKTIEGECGIITPVEPIEEETVEEETAVEEEEAGTSTESLNEETLLDDSIVIYEIENITTNANNSLEIIEEIGGESEQIIPADSMETGSTSEITPIPTDELSIVAD